MKIHVFLMLLLTAALGACAGNPPAWWNPSNTYQGGSERPRSGTVSAARQTPSAGYGEVEMTPTEENIAPLPDQSYEEMILTPLQDEETENASGEASSQSAAPSSALLPPPSVLE